MSGKNKSKPQLVWIDDAIEMRAPYVAALETIYHVKKVGSLKEAIEWVDDPGEFDVAIIDLDLRQENYDPPPGYAPFAGVKLANDLANATGRPMVIVSGYLDQIDRSQIDNRHGVAFVDKGLITVKNLFIAIQGVYPQRSAKT